MVCLCSHSHLEPQNRLWSGGDCNAEVSLVRRLSYVALGLACILVVVLALQNRAVTHRSRELLVRAVSPHPGVYVPSVALVTLDGKHVTIGEAQQGGGQILFVFTTTCRFCRASLPAWQSIARQVRSSEKNFEVYGVSLDSVDATKDYVASHGLAFPTVRFPPGRLPTLYRAQNVPLTMIVDSQGLVTYARLGVLTSQSAVDSILQIIARGVSSLGKMTALNRGRIYEANDQEARKRAVWASDRRGIRIWDNPSNGVNS